LALRAGRKWQVRRRGRKVLRNLIDGGLGFGHFEAVCGTDGAMKRRRAANHKK
jgi:hypothetical protein